MNDLSSTSALAAGQRDELERALLRTYFRNVSKDYARSDAFRGDLRDHVEGRYLHFANAVVPWIKRHVDISDHIVIEVGAGTGSSTAAIAPHVSQVIAFDISENSVEAARARSNILGYKNSRQIVSLFSEKGASALPPVDGVFLAAVLEHCSFDECLDLLRNAWRSLKPGGWLCVVDTPNRLAPVDYHTSMLPFFSSLPIDIRIAYAKRSPRDLLSNAFKDKPLSDDLREKMIRWGCGISYHEFELAISPDVHSWVVADGWEAEINGAIGILPDDLMIDLQMKTFAPSVNRAFSRRTLYLIIQKPERLGQQ